MSVKGSILATVMTWITQEKKRRFLSMVHGCSFLKGLELVQQGPCFRVGLSVQSTAFNLWLYTRQFLFTVISGDRREDTLLWLSVHDIFCSTHASKNHLNQVNVWHSERIKELKWIKKEKEKHLLFLGEKIGEAEELTWMRFQKYDSRPRAWKEI